MMTDTPLPGVFYLRVLHYLLLMNIATARPYSENAQLFWYGHISECQVFRDADYGFIPDGWTTEVAPDSDGRVYLYSEFYSEGSRDDLSEKPILLRHGPQPA